MSGVVPALITPFDDSFEVRYPELRRLVRYQLDLGVVGFYVCGSSGESFSLSPSERKAIVDTVVDAVAGRAGTIVHISHMEYRMVLELAKHAHACGADAVSILPPLYFPVTDDEVRHYYLSILDQIELPLVLYNIPALSGRGLDEGTVETLATHPNLVGIKYTSEDTDMLDRFKRIDGGRLMVWSARDAYYVSCLAMGADGAIGTSYNLYADVFAEITRAFRASDIGRARTLQSEINRIQRHLYEKGAYQSIKRCITLMGIDAGGCRPPFGPIESDADDHLKTTLQMLDDFRHRWGLASRPAA